MSEEYFKNKDTIMCPHCGKDQQYLAVDYAPDQIGESEEYECEWCYKEFIVSRIDDRLIKVEE